MKRAFGVMEVVRVVPTMFLHRRTDAFYESPELGGGIIGDFQMIYAAKRDAVERNIDPVIHPAKALVLAGRDEGPLGAPAKLPSLAESAPPRHSIG